MGYAFLSYSHADAAFVDALIAKLNEAGVKVWADRYDLRPGAEWTRAIEYAVTDADALICIASQTSLRSRWVLEEVRLGVAHAIPVLPVIVDDTAARSMPPFLSAFRWLNAHEAAGDPLVHRLIHALPSTVRGDRPPAPEPPKSKGSVFISFAEPDADFASELRDFLISRNYGFWDSQSSDREYQTRLFLELEARIRESAATLSVLSPDWKRSRWAPKEYLFTQEVGVPVFLLMVREMGPTLVLAGMPFIDFVRDKAHGFALLDKELQRQGLP